MNGRGLDSATQDIRYAYRSLRRSPAFTVVVIAMLALGIAANLTMFSLLRAVLWRPLPYPDPDRLVVVQIDARNISNAGATMAEVCDLRERSRTLERVATVRSADANLEYAGEMEHVSAAEVSDDFLPLLGVRPALGRHLQSRIDRSRQPILGVLISDELWRRRFSADPGVIGRAIRIDSWDMQIAGVLPPGVRIFPPSVISSGQVDVWFPLPIDPAIPYRGLPVLARLRPGVSLAESHAELQMFAGEFAKQYPVTYAGGQGRIGVRLLHDDMTREVRPALFLLMGAVGFVLLMSCVNVANLLLSRGLARQREIEIRSALGAGSRRMIRQFLTESLVLSAVASGVGLVLSYWGLEMVGKLTGSYLPMQSGIAIDATVAAFAVALTLLTGILFGLLPAWRLAGNHHSNRLRAGRASTPAPGARRLQRMLVVAEVGLSIVPLAAAGLMLRSFLNLMNSPLGFRSENIVTAKVPINTSKHPEAGQQWAFLQDVLDRLRALPSVKSASAAWPLPLANDQQTRRVGRADQLDTPPVLATQQFVLPGYLGVIGTVLRQGRDFTADDVALQRSVTIIDESLARRLWPEGAVGKRLAVHRTGRRDELEVVGVTSPVRVTRVRDGNLSHFMLPYGSYPASMTLVVNTGEKAERLAPWIQSAVRDAKGERAPFDILPMSDYVARSVGDTRFLMLVLGAFAGMSLLLAAIGLYATLAHLTVQRTREFGIRLALGSTANAVVGIVVRESVVLAAAGAAVGLLGVMAVTGAIRRQLYGVEPLDALTLVAVVVLVGMVALGAAALPAWRATQVDPQTSLRTE